MNHQIRPVTVTLMLTTNKCGVKTMKRRILIGMCVALTVATGLMAGWRSYDPTVPWNESEERIKTLVMHASSGKARIVESRSEPFRPDKATFWVRNNPRYYRPLRGRLSGFPDSSSSVVAETPNGRLRCYSHFFRGRTVAFTVVSSSTNADAWRLVSELETVYPGLPVHVIHSESYTMEDPIR